MTEWTKRYHNLDYDSAVALRYHGRRQGFLDFLARLDPALTVIFGGTAFATVMAGFPNVAAGAALIATLSSALNLAFGLGDRARLHESLFRRWGAIRAELVFIEGADDRSLRQLEVKRAQFDAESPWQMLALSTMCENEKKAMRRSGALYRVGWIQRTCASLFTLPGWSPVEDVQRS